MELFLDRKIMSNLQNMAEVDVSWCETQPQNIYVTRAYLSSSAIYTLHTSTHSVDTVQFSSVIFFILG